MPNSTNNAKDGIDYQIVSLALSKIERDIKELNKMLISLNNIFSQIKSIVDDKKIDVDDSIAFNELDAIFDRLLKYNGKAVKSWTRQGCVIKADLLRVIKNSKYNINDDVYQAWLKNSRLVEIKVRGVRQIKDDKKAMCLTCVTHSDNVWLLMSKGLICKPRDFGASNA